jgi:hypothetical protein
MRESSRKGIIIEAVMGLMQIRWEARVTAHHRRGEVDNWLIITR